MKMPAARRAFLKRLLVPAAMLTLAGRVGAAPAAAGPGTLVQVWKSPTCGCCKEWITHLESHGFRVQVQDTGNTAARARLGVDMRFGSCHTAGVQGYVIEGHVPAREIVRLLAERPKALGLAVPGMPLGSPGMDGPEYGGRREPYDVLLLTGGETSRVYHAYR